MTRSDIPPVERASTPIAKSRRLTTSVEPDRAGLLNVSTSDNIVPVIDPDVLDWAGGFIDALARGEYSDLHTLDDLSFNQHVALAQVVPEKLRDRQAAVRRAAAWVAGAADVVDDRTVPLLVRLLRDRSASTRMAAAWACGELGEDAAEAVPALVAALGDRDNGVQAAAVCGLGGIRAAAASAIPALIAFVAAQPAGGIRARAIRALAEIGPEVAEVQRVLEGALEGPDPDEQFAAAYGMGLVADPPTGASERLTGILAAADPYLVTVTVWALGKLAGRLGPNLAPALLDALRRMHWLRIEHNELPGDEFVSIRPEIGEALARHLPATDDADYEDFRLKFFLHVFHPPATKDPAWIDDLVNHRWYLKIQRRRFGHPGSAAERAAIRDLVREAQAKFAERMLRNPTLGLSPADYARLPGFIRNHCRNIAWRLRERRRKDRAHYSGPDVERVADPRPSGAASNAAGAEVLEVIETYLPAPERDVARLILLLDHTIPEAAAALDLTPSQVKTRLANAKRRLAERLR